MRALRLSNVCENDCMSNGRIHGRLQLMQSVLNAVRNRVGGRMRMRLVGPKKDLFDLQYYEMTRKIEH